MPTFHLKVIQIEQVCLFELTWKPNHRLNAKVIYPTTLSNYYHDWQRNYLSFYRAQLRGSAGVSVSLAEIPKDWYGPLGVAEKQLRREFQYWLDSADLKPIRQVMVDAANQVGEALILVSCDHLAIAKLPWEAWQLGTMANVNVQILRTSLNHTATDAATHRRGKTRILAIIGDGCGSFQATFYEGFADFSRGFLLISEINPGCITFSSDRSAISLKLCRHSHQIPIVLRKNTIRVWSAVCKPKRVKAWSMGN